MDVQPNLYIKTDFVSPATANVRIGNNGPVAVTQLAVLFEAHIYVPNARDFMGMGSWSNEDVISTLAPYEEKRLEGRRWVAGPSHYQDRRCIREIRLVYRRESDLKQFIERALYFYNTEGEWVSDEHFSPSTAEEVEMVRAIRSLPVEPPDGFRSDRLHRPRVERQK
jgi:hypothetical protein